MGKGSCSWVCFRTPAALIGKTRFRMAACRYISKKIINSPALTQGEKAPDLPPALKAVLTIHPVSATFTAFSLRGSSRNASSRTCVHGCRKPFPGGRGLSAPPTAHPAEVNRYGRREASLTARNSHQLRGQVMPLPPAAAWDEVGLRTPVRLKEPRNAGSMSV